MLEQQIQEDIKAAMKAKVREIIAQVGATAIKDMANADSKDRVQQNWGNPKDF